MDGVASNQSSVPREEGCLNPEYPEISGMDLVEGQMCWCWTAYDETWWLIGNEAFCIEPSSNNSCLDVICKTWVWNSFIKCYLGEYPPGIDTLVPDTDGLAH